MYGMLLESVEHFLKEKYGEKTWNLIRLRAGVKKHVFVTHERYPDSLMLDIAGAASEVIGKQTDMTPDDFIQFFGVCFVKFFSNYGYDRIIRVSGRHFRDFLSGIDNLHEHMRFGYPKLMSPSFYCAEETSSGLVLHYKSKRNGLYRYVIGQILEVARTFFDIALEIKVLDVISSGNGCHATYRLNFDNSAFKPIIPDMLAVRENRSLSCETFLQLMPFSFVVSANMKIVIAGDALISTLGGVVGNRANDLFSLRRPRREFSWENIKTWNVICELVAKLPCLRTNGLKKLPLRPMRSLDRAQFLSSLSRVADNHQEETSKTKSSILAIMDEIECHNNNSVPFKPIARKHSEVQTVTRKGPLLPSLHAGKDFYPDKTIRQLHLRGNVKYLKKNDLVLFICSPMIASLDEMALAGMYMSDLGLYDSSQEMVLSGIQSLPQLEYARDQLLDRGKSLEESLQKLEQERQRSEQLLCRMMPKAVADRLKDGQKAIETCEFFDSVTIMFSYLDGFDRICTKVTPMEVVSLVNKMFLTFDTLSEKHDVYKFETLGDAQYMVVNGVPVRKDHHVEPVAAMALDILESMDELKDPSTGKPLTITIGMHMGPVAAGLVGEKMPQYCLFGDSVNMAARLRTTSLPMRIQISESCKQSLKGSDFLTEFRGLIELKGRGKTRTYWLTGRRHASPIQVSPALAAS
ncbi:soluble guanylate cyclase 88E-like [Montipora capricornis]|uniref:soluble guanylate cyclase 88E-like n=1 Tax=Montipora capricornis TaxID=246305 RepID=UPI0035F16097